MQTVIWFSRLRPVQMCSRTASAWAKSISQILHRWCSNIKTSNGRMNINIKPKLFQTQIVIEYKYSILITFRLYLFLLLLLLVVLKYAFKLNKSIIIFINSSRQQRKRERARKREGAELNGKKNGLVQRDCPCPTPSACRHSTRPTTTSALCHFVVNRVANRNVI